MSSETSKSRQIDDLINSLQSIPGRPRPPYGGQPYNEGYNPYKDDPPDELAPMEPQAMMSSQRELEEEALQRQMQGWGWQGRQPGQGRSDVDDNGNLIPVPIEPQTQMMIQLLRQLPPEQLMAMAQGKAPDDGLGPPTPLPKDRPYPPMPVLPGKQPV